MSGDDTQWPRYEIFQQSRPDSPFQNVGSVHAPDAEMALQNARDVFVRRPQTAALWVVPAASILMVTQEELAAGTLTSAPDVPEAGSPQSYVIFTKSSQRRAMTFVSYQGEVEATSARGALEAAVQPDGGEGTYVWWVVPADAITRSQSEDAESLFAPAHDKAFRLPSAYHTRTLMDEVRQGRTEPDDGA